MNTTRILHSVNIVLWLINAVVWGFVAHSAFMAITALGGAVVSLILARNAGDGR